MVVRKSATARVPCAHYGLCGAVFLLYAYWPKKIWDRPIGTLAAHEIITPIVFIILALFLIRALFNPADDDFIRRAWGWLGVVLIVASPMFASYILLR
jgi:cobalamin biosynthesis protein CobD/CbiB